MVDPLPLTLPAMTEQSGKNAGSKGSVVSVAALPAFFRNSPEPGETISADETFQAAEILGAGPRQEESTQPGMEWFNRTGLVRMQARNARPGPSAELLLGYCRRTRGSRRWKRRGYRHAAEGGEWS